MLEFVLFSFCVYQTCTEITSRFPVQLEYGIEKDLTLLPFTRQLGLQEFVVISDGSLQQEVYLTLKPSTHTQIHIHTNTHS